MKLLLINIIIILVGFIAYQYFVIHNNNKTIENNDYEMAQYDSRKKIVEDSIVLSRNESLNLQKENKDLAEITHNMTANYLKETRFNEIKELPYQEKYFLTASLNPKYQRLVEEFLMKNKNTQIDSLCGFVQLSFSDMNESQIANMAINYIQPWLLDGIFVPFILCKPVMNKYIVLTNERFERIALINNISATPLLRVYFEKDYFLSSKFQSMGYLNLQCDYDDELVYPNATYENK